MENTNSESEVTNEEFNEIIRSNNHVVVNFFAEWHMSCLMLTPIIEDLAEQLKNVRFIKINIEDNKELKEKHNIFSMPCVIIFKKGNEIERISGSHAADIIEEKIRSCVC